MCGAEHLSKNKEGNKKIQGIWGRRDGRKCYKGLVYSVLYYCLKMNHNVCALKMPNKV